MTSKGLYWGIVTFAMAGSMVASLAVVNARQAAGGAVAIDNDDVGGVVTGPNGPEAGVWVIAETRSLPTRLIKTVVTDDQGRYLVPDLPKGDYDIWVRGYGLVDSPKVKATPGKTVNLKAVAAPNKRAAAEYYPAQYWFSLLQLPPKSDFPGTGAKGNGISENIKFARPSTQTAAPVVISSGTRPRARSPRVSDPSKTRGPHGIDGFRPVRPAAG
jgi:hypothetical protein